MSSEGGAKGPREKKKNFKKKEKFQPQFKKKIPKWKQIDSEANELVSLYDQVVFKNNQKSSKKKKYLITLLLILRLTQAK